MNRQPLSEISTDSIDTYRRDGIVCLRRMFDAGWIAFMVEAVDRAMAAPGRHGEEYARSGGRFFGDLDLWQRHEPFRRFVFESPAAAIAGRLMESTKVNFFYDQLLVKEPGTAERTPWHQDQPYWAVAGRQVCSLWVPFDPVPEETCVEYVAGSHDWPAFSHYHFADGTPYANTGLPPLPDLDARPEQRRRGKA